MKIVFGNLSLFCCNLGNLSRGKGDADSFSMCMSFVIRHECEGDMSPIEGTKFLPLVAHYRCVVITIESYSWMEVLDLTLLRRIRKHVLCKLQLVLTCVACLSWKQRTFYLLCSFHRKSEPETAGLHARFLSSTCALDNILHLPSFGTSSSRSCEPSRCALVYKFRRARGTLHARAPSHQPSIVRQIHCTRKFAYLSFVRPLQLFVAVLAISTAH